MQLFLTLKLLFLLLHDFGGCFITEQNKNDLLHFFLALSTLEKKNKQLDLASKELEQKVKSLRQKSQLCIPPTNNVTKVKK